MKEWVPPRKRRAGRESQCHIGLPPACGEDCGQKGERWWDTKTAFTTYKVLLVEEPGLQRAHDVVLIYGRVQMDEVLHLGQFGPVDGGGGASGRSGRGSGSTGRRPRRLLLRVRRSPRAHRASAEGSGGRGGGCGCGGGGRCRDGVRGERTSAARAGIRRVRTRGLRGRQGVRPNRALKGRIAFWSEKDTN